jgi:hypothetical protein
LLHGLPVIVHNTRPDIASEGVLEQLDRALGLIAVHAPRQLQRMRHDLAGIWVQRFACRAAYFPGARACMIELTFLAHPDISAAQVAASILHEAMHARIATMRVGNCADRPAREERLCRRVELDFGRLVPGGEVVVARALESLALTDSEVAPAIDWAVARRRVGEADRLG